MGTFDILNLRLNGYDFHVGLMAGKEKWTDPKVTAVFKKWAEFLPYHAKDYAGLTWQNAADTLVQKKSGMYLLGLFVSAQFRRPRTPADLDDLDFFPFPNLGTQYDAEKALDAPIDTIQITRQVAQARRRARCREGLPRVLVQGLDPAHHVQEPAGRSSRRPRTPTPAATAPSRRRPSRSSAQAQKITQYLDRDTRSDFAGANGAQSLLQKFLANPTQDLVAYQKSIQDFWDQLPRSDLRLVS